jgi:lipopolysaccharide export system protein LptA
MRRRLLAATVAVLAGLMTAPVLAQVTITADSFMVDEANSEATFTGNVEVVYTGLRVWANKVVADYAEGSMENIRSFTATGNVRLKTDDQDATGDRAVFDPKTQVLRLLGNVRVVNAAGTLNGPELVVDLANNTSVFSGGSGGRVTGVFSTQ